MLSEKRYNLGMSSSQPVSTQRKYSVVLALLVICTMTFISACQAIIGSPYERLLPPTASSTPSITATPTVQVTFTHLPGDLYFVYQTQTAAPTSYSRVGWNTAEVYKTMTPQYGLTQAALVVTSYTCLLAYPDFCVLPDIRIGCTQLLYQGKHDFTVYTPDPFGYDKDGNGIGCEVGKPTSKPRDKE